MNPSRHWWRGLHEAAGKMEAEAIRMAQNSPPFSSPRHAGQAILIELDELGCNIEDEEITASLDQAIKVGAAALRYIVEVEAMRQARTTAQMQASRAAKNKRDHASRSARRRRAKARKDAEVNCDSCGTAMQGAGECPNCGDWLYVPPKVVS